MYLRRQDGAAAPGQVSPKSDNAPWQGRVIERVMDYDDADCAAPAASHKADDGEKRLASLRDALALRGWHFVRALNPDGFQVTWRGLSRECCDLNELAAYSRRVEAIR
jgi:hypothetical protein